MNQNSQHIQSEYIGVIFVPRMNGYIPVIEDAFSDIKVSGGLYDTAYDAAKIRTYMLLQLPAHVRARIPSNFTPRAEDSEARAVLANPARMPKTVPRISVAPQNFNVPAKPTNTRKALKGSTSTASRSVSDPWASFGRPEYVEWLKEMDANYAEPTASHASHASHMTNEEAEAFLQENSNNDPDRPSYATRHPRPPYGSAASRRGRKGRKSRRSRRRAAMYVSN